MKKVLSYSMVLTVVALMAAQAQDFDGPRERGQCSREGDQKGCPQFGERGERGGPGERGERGGPGGGMERMMRNPEMAGLSEEQIAKMKEKMYEHRKEMIDLKSAVEKAELELDQAMAAEQPDKAAVMSAIDELAAARTAMQKARIGHQLKMRAMCHKREMRKNRQQGDENMKGEDRAARKAERKALKNRGPQGDPGEEIDRE